MTEGEKPNDVPPASAPAPEKPESRSFFKRSDGAKSPKEALQPQAAPPPPPRPKKKRAGLLHSISAFLSFFLVLMIGAVVGYSIFLKELKVVGPLPADRAVVILPGSDGVEIADQLVNEGVVNSSVMFTLGMRMHGQSAKQLKAGEYLFKQGASLQDVIDTLANGKAILHNLTVPEGWTSQMAVDRLRDNDMLTGDVRDVPPEGAIFPDTYKFSKGAQREQVLRQMQEAAKKVVAEVWTKRASDIPLKSPYELVTLASIVEKETAKADERARVAAVYINRLNRHMRLQSDPTIVYGLVGGKGTLGHPIQKDELSKLTPYNTYLVEGLPPGPIANPGRAALEAVANPSRTKELYFVADGTGGHVFAETLDQHAKNVTRWRQIEKDAKDKLAPDALPTQPVKPGTQGLNEDGSAPNLGLTSADDDIAAKAKAQLAAKLGAVEGSGSKFGGLSIAAHFNVPRGPDLAENVEVGQAQPAATYPISPGMQADLRARSSKYGEGIATFPTPSSADAGAPVKYRVTDASEGTSFDPLLDKTFDLNTAKVIPKLR